MKFFGIGRICSALFAGLLLSSSFGVLAATPSPQMMAQLQQMSPREQKALAKQYGIELPQGIGGAQQQADPGVLGAPGEPIEVFDRVPRYFDGLDRRSDEQFRRYQRGLEGEKDELERFGLSIFDREISTFSPVDDMPVPENYALGPGDSVNVLLYGKEQEELLLMVTRDGKLQFPRLGSVSVAGMTFADLKAVIEERVKRQFVGTSAVVSVGKLRSINVFLAGEVVAPGSYSVSGLSTVTQVLYAAGGVTDIGTLRNIQVKRQGKTVVSLDMYDLLLRGNTSGDIRLSSGDTVFVPVMNSLVTADGEVRRPALYETLASDSVGSLLQMAGGVAAQGYSRSASISRYEDGETSRSRIQLNLDDEADLTVKVVDGDYLEVERIKEDIRSQVTLRGSVARPGGFAWRDGLRVSDLLGSIDDDLLDETDLNTGLIVRRTGQGLEVEALGFSLLEAMQHNGSDADLLLRPNDEVIIFSLPYVNDSYKKVKALAEHSSARLRGRDGQESIRDRLVKQKDGSYKVAPIIEKKSFESERGSERETAREDERIAVYEAESQYSYEFEAEEKEDRQDLIADVVDRFEAQALDPSMTETVSVTGDVRMPGIYPLLKSRKLGLVLNLAGGFEASALLDRAEVTRTSFGADGSASLRSIVIPLKDVLSGESEFELEARDQVQIKRVPNWSFGDVVEISGSVMFPGEYPIGPGESLSSILVRAGGLNQVAFAEGAILIKTSAKKREQEQIRKLVASIQRNEISRSRTRENEENAGAQSELASREELIDLLLDEDVGGRVVIDLSAILMGDEGADIGLQAGDSLFVPEFSNTVSVIGEVREPGTFRFQQDRTVNDYVEYAAGASTRALAKEIYVVRANGAVERLGGGRKLFKFDSTRSVGIRPGDTIVVPVNEDYQPTLTKYREVTTVVFNSVASLFPLFRL
jgi:polysaccharide export outer membrane protein